MTKLGRLKLPSELILLVLEHLCGARPGLLSRGVLRTLRSLCLVSHEVRDLAQPLLYKTLRLRDDLSATLLTRTLRGKPHLKHSIRAAWWGKVNPLDQTWRPPPAHEAAWYSVSRIGGLLVGHHYCTKPAGTWCQDGDLSALLACKATLSNRGGELRVPWAYHLVVCTLENWMPLMLRSAEWSTITHLTVTLYPSLWIDQDLFEHVLRTLLSHSALPLLEHLTLLVGHDGFAAGSRVRRIDRSRAIAAAASRIADSRLRVLGAPTHFGTAGQGLAEDVEKYTRGGWEARLRGEKGPWIGTQSIAAFTPISHQVECAEML